MVKSIMNVRGDRITSLHTGNTEIFFLMLVVEISFSFHPLVWLFLFIVAYYLYVDARDTHLPKYLKFFILCVVLCSIFQIKILL